jgi:phosphoenolpyruvate synthase/pyruvate phosphate dikinase
MAKELPEAFKQLMDTFTLLEKNYRDMQDIEFTIMRSACPASMPGMAAWRSSPLALAQRSCTSCRRATPSARRPPPSRSLSTSSQRCVLGSPISDCLADRLAAGAPTYKGVISKKEAVMRVDPMQLASLMHKKLDPVAAKKAKIVARGLPASPGAAVGQIVFTADRAVELKAKGQVVLLVRTETSPEDISGMVGHARRARRTSGRIR